MQKTGVTIHLEPWTGQDRGRCLFHAGVCLLYLILDLFFSLSLPSDRLWVGLVAATAMTVSIAIDLRTMWTKDLLAVPFSGRRVLEGKVFALQTIVFMYVIVIVPTCAPACLVLVLVSMSGLLAANTYIGAD